MDTPWLYIYTAHKLSQLQPHTLQLNSEVTASKWLTIRNLLLEGFYRDRGREKEARLKLFTPAATYIQVRRGEAAPVEHLKYQFEVSDVQSHWMYKTFIFHVGIKFRSNHIK